MTTAGEPVLSIRKKALVLSRYCPAVDLDGRGGFPGRFESGVRPSIAKAERRTVDNDFAFRVWVNMKNWRLVDRYWPEQQLFHAQRRGYCAQPGQYTVLQFQ